VNLKYYPKVIVKKLSKAKELTRMIIVQIKKESMYVLSFLTNCKVKQGRPTERPI